MAAPEWSHWLRDEWLPDGPPVCVIEGFPGVGKSALARWLVQKSDLPGVIVQLAASSLALDDALVEAAIALDDLGFAAMAARDDGNLLQGLEEVLRSPVLLVIDNFEHLLDLRTGLPDAQFWQFVVRLSSRYSHGGRLLLVTSRSLPEGSWQETIAVKTITSPDEDAAIKILNQLLTDRHREDAVPFARRRDVVQWLGGNPRAIQALVTCLAEDELEDLIDLEPDAWEMRDQMASQKLVEQLELRFLAHTLERLDTSALMLLECLCVYRKLFTRDAIERTGPELSQARTELAQRFILDRHKAKFSVNKIAQQLARARLATNPQRLQLAQRLAADHFSRHFRTRGGYDSPDKGTEFVEARYHLLQSGREREFEEIASTFRRGLLLAYGRSDQLPLDLKSRRELVPTLLAALRNDDYGYWQIRYLLARLLVDRGHPGDALLALRQVTVATRDSLFHGVWQLRQTLAWELEGRVAMRAATDQATDKLPTQSLTGIYYKSAKLLATGGYVEEALSDLDRATKICRSNSDVSALYQLAAMILSSQHRDAAAYEKLLQFIESNKVKGTNVKRSAEQAMFCALAIRDTKALEHLIEIFAANKESDMQRALGRHLLLQAQGRYADACEIERPAQAYIALNGSIAFCYLCLGRQQDALDAIPDSQSTNAAGAWLAALTAYCNGLDAISCNALERVTGRPVTTDELLAGIVTTWAHPMDVYGVYPAFYFPVLPSELTGLDYDISRLTSWGLDVDDILAKIRFPRITHPDATVTAEQGFADSIAPDISPSLNVTIAPSIVSLANAEGGKGMTGDRYEIGQAGAVGPGATAHDIQFTQVWNKLSTDTNLNALAAELVTLRTAMRERSTEPGQDLALAEVSRAQLAASDGDGPRTLSHLARAGQWALGIATAIGTNVAAAAIKSSLGL